MSIIVEEQDSHSVTNVTMTDYEENKGGSKTMVVLNTSGINKEEE